jgi:hypothetical protein
MSLKDALNTVISSIIHESVNQIFLRKRVLISRSMLQIEPPALSSIVRLVGSRDHIRYSHSPHRQTNLHLLLTRESIETFFLLIQPICISFFCALRPVYEDGGRTVAQKFISTLVPTMENRLARLEIRVPATFKRLGNPMVSTKTAQ